MVNKYYNKASINETVRLVYGFIGEKGLSLDAISEIYADQVSAQRAEEDISLPCCDFTVWFCGERISVRERFALSLVDLFNGSKDKTKAELLSFFNTLSL